MQRGPLDSSPRPSPSPLGGTFGVLLAAFGLGVLGAFALDLHSHQCCKCGHRWRHLGAFNFGDEGAHTCAGCGTVQWWKDGVPHAFRDARAKIVTKSATASASSQESRAPSRGALPSGTTPPEPRRWVNSAKENL